MAKISIVIPVGDMSSWTVCEKSIRDSVAAYAGDVEAEILPCFDLERRGVSVARNEGLSRATGDWIAWVDCDDVVESDWFREIAQAATSHSDCDLIQYEATEVKDGKVRRLGFPLAGEIPGETFALEFLRGEGMPAWLWTRVFRREVFSGCAFDGLEKEDTRMFLCVLPRIRKVWSIGKPIYNYHRHGAGLSNHRQSVDWFAWGADCDRLIARMPTQWQEAAKVGQALTLADVALHSKDDRGARRWVRRYFPKVIFDLKVSFRSKAKCLLVCLGVSCCHD